MGCSLSGDWVNEIGSEWEPPYFRTLMQFLEEEKQSGCITYPPEDLIFNAFHHTAYAKVKVVILGQDPYHGKGQAHGLSFSVPSGIKPPPSLKNIYKELAQDGGVAIRSIGDLTSWAQQGVLLLNTTLTVRQSEPKSHYGKGWELFTDSVLRVLLARKDPIVFLLWGKIAQEKVRNLPKNIPHLILMAAHPSPYSAYLFLGCKHFSQTNEQLIKWNKTQIDWCN